MRRWQFDTILGKAADPVLKIMKRTMSVVEVAEHFCTKCETLSSNTSTTKTNKKLNRIMKRYFIMVT
jgi:hypothetical protein